MNEDANATRKDRFGITYRVDEHDCLYYAAALEARGHDVFFVNWNDLQGRQFARMFHDNRGEFIEPVPLEQMDLAWIYQMEGFYSQLSRFLHMLDVLEDACARVINDPRTIRHNLGKTYLMALAERGVRIIPTYPIGDDVKRRLHHGQRVVLKPIYGERGKGVFLARTADDLARIAGREDQYLAQAYVPGIRSGEKSLVFLGLDHRHAVLKRPCAARADEFRCNESLGGTVSVYDPTSAEIAYAQQVLRTYAALGCPVHYSRIDFVDTECGPALMEAELLNPAAFANYSGKGARFGAALADYVTNLIARSPPLRDISPARAAHRQRTAIACNP